MTWMIWGTPILGTPHLYMENFMVDFPLLIWKDGITLWHSKMAMDNPPFSLWKSQFMYIYIYIYICIYIYIYIYI